MREVSSVTCGSSAGVSATLGFVLTLPLRIRAWDGLPPGAAGRVPLVETDHVLVRSGPQGLLRARRSRLSWHRPGAGRGRQRVDEQLRHGFVVELGRGVDGVEQPPGEDAGVDVGAHLVAVGQLDDGLIGGRNPCVGVRLPRITNPPVLPLSVEQVTALLNEADDWFAVAIAIGAGLGLRQSEASKLTVDRIDFLRRVVTVDRQWQQSSGSRPGAFAPPKTEASTRLIPADDWVLERVAAHLATFGAATDGVIIQVRSLRPDGAQTGRAAPDGQLPRSPPLLRERAHPRRVQRQAGTTRAWPQVGQDDARRVRASLARRGGPRPRCHRPGVSADRGLSTDFSQPILKVSPDQRLFSVGSCTCRFNV